LVASLNRSCEPLYVDFNIPVLTLMITAYIWTYPIASIKIFC